jgi:hypothetical protein
MTTLTAIMSLIVIVGTCCIISNLDLKRREKKYKYPKATISKEVNKLLEMNYNKN